MRHTWDLKQSNHGEYDLVPLKERIQKRYGCYRRFGERVGMTTEHVCNVVNGKATFTFASIVEWSEALAIPTSKIGKYFFTKKEDMKNDRIKGIRHDG